MLTLAEALESVFLHLPVMDTEELPLRDSNGRIAAQDYTAPAPVPAWASAAMDGFAVRAEDVRTASTGHPVRLKVIAAVMAGSKTSRRVIPGTTARIMTGAPLPAGADSVIPLEDTAGSQDSPSAAETLILHPGQAGQYINSAGHQIARGEKLVTAGAVIGPGQVLLLASAGMARVKVYRRPLVAIAATGSELAGPGRTLREAQIHSGTIFALAALVRRCGGAPRLLGTARDTPAAITALLTRGARADLLVTTGGAGGGDRDLVKTILARMGELVFPQVRMQPGKATGFGLLPAAGGGREVRIPHFILSGSPPAALAGFVALVRPALLRMAGHSDYRPQALTACLEGELSNPAEFLRLVWVTLEDRAGSWLARPLRRTGAGSLTGLAGAAGLALVPPQTAALRPGDGVQVLALDCGNLVPSPGV